MDSLAHTQKDASGICTVQTNFEKTPLTDLTKIQFHSTYCVTNESWGNSLEELALLNNQKKTLKGPFVGVGISGIQLGLVALYGELFDDIIFFDTNPYALSLFQDILQTIHTHKPSWEMFWQTYFDVNPTAGEHIQQSLLLKALQTYDLKAKLGYELISGNLLNQRKDTVFANTLRYHPFAQSSLFDAFIQNISGKTISLIHGDVMSDNFTLPIKHHSASIVYTNGLMRFLNKKRHHGSFNDVARKLNTTLGNYLSANSIILEESDTNYYLRAAPYHTSILYAAKECSTFEETKKRIKI